MTGMWQTGLPTFTSWLRRHSRRDFRTEQEPVRGGGQGWFHPLPPLAGYVLTHGGVPPPDHSERWRRMSGDSTAEGEWSLAGLTAASHISTSVRPVRPSDRKSIGSSIV